MDRTKTICSKKIERFWPWKILYGRLDPRRNSSIVWLFGQTDGSSSENQFNLQFVGGQCFMDFNYRWTDLKKLSPTKWHRTLYIHIDIVRVIGDIHRVVNWVVKGFENCAQNLCWSEFISCSHWTPIQIHVFKKQN